MSDIEIAESKFINLFGNELGNDFIEFFRSYRKRKIKQSTYLFFDKGSGYYKIGKAKDVSERYNIVKGMCPMLEFVASCYKDIEKELHNHFESKKSTGEWFNLTDKDVE